MMIREFEAFLRIDQNMQFQILKIAIPLVNDAIQPLVRFDNLQTCLLLIDPSVLESANVPLANPEAF